MSVNNVISSVLLICGLRNSGVFHKILKAGFWMFTSLQGLQLILTMALMLTFNGQCHYKIWYGKPTIDQGEHASLNEIARYYLEEIGARKIIYLVLTHLIVTTLIEDIYAIVETCIFQF